MIPNRQHMEQMTVGMTSYFLSISKLQASAMADPAPSELSPVGSVIVLNFEALGQAESQDKKAGTAVGVIWSPLEQVWWLQEKTKVPIKQGNLRKGDHILVSEAFFLMLINTENKVIQK